MNNIEAMREKIKLCDMTQPFLFISYSKKDADKVYPMVLDLQNLGINIWIDKNLEDQAGKSWQDEAFKAIRSGYCEKVVFFMSKQSLFSIPVCAELKYTLHKKVIINHGGKKVEVIPVSIDEDGNIGKVKNKCLSDAHSKEMIGEDAYKNIFSNCLNEDEQEYFDATSNYGALITTVYASVFDGNSEINVVSDVSSIIKNIPQEMIKKNSNDIVNNNKTKESTPNTVITKKIDNTTQSDVIKNEINEKIEYDNIPNSPKELNNTIIIPKIKEIIAKSEGRLIKESDAKVSEDSFRTKVLDSLLPKHNELNGFWDDKDKNDWPYVCGIYARPDQNWIKMLTTIKLRGRDVEKTDKIFQLLGIKLKGDKMCGLKTFKFDLDKTTTKEDIENWLENTTKELIEYHKWIVEQFNK